jgi:hypothetical protein
MASKAFIRTILVVVLLVTAHTIKPFTFGSVAIQALGTARSLSFVLPEFAAERIEHAHYLAYIYGKGLFDDESSTWTQQNVLRSGLVAMANSVETFDDAEIKDAKPGDSNRKAIPKRSIKRIKRDEVRDEDSECAKNVEIANLPDVRSVKTVSYMTPASVLNYQPRLIKTGFITTAVKTELMKLQETSLANCDSPGLPELKTTALIQHLPKLRNLQVELILVSKPASLTAVCRDAGVTRIETVSAPVEIVVGPQEEFYEAATEEFYEPAPAPPAVISIPRTPECIWIP